MQQSDVRLSDEGKILLNNLFDDAIQDKGVIPEVSINKLYNGNAQLNL
jgi:hypothetical protein